MPALLASLGLHSRLANRIKSLITGQTMNRTLQSFFALPLILALFGTAWAQARRPMVPADILRVASISDAQVSPDGESIVYTLSTNDGNQTLNTLWLVRPGERSFRIPPTGRLPEQRRNAEIPITPGRPLLPAGWNASNPRWSPDGKSIAFISTHEEQHGIWVSDLASRLPRLVAAVRETNFFITYAGESFAWSPDSKMIAYISAGEDMDQDFAGGANKSDDPRVVDRIQYKSRTALADRLRTHVWIVNVEKSDNEPRQLTAGPFYDHALSFSPRGDEIAFLSNHESDPDANNNSDIFAVNLQAQVRQITQTPGCEYEPAWSPDGKWIAYIATKRELTTIDSVAEDTHVWITSVTGDNRRELTADLNRRARTPRWRSDSAAIYFAANDRGQSLVYEVTLEPPRVQAVFGATNQSGDGASFPEFRGSLDSAGPIIVDHRIQVSTFSVSNQLDAGELVSGSNRLPIRIGVIAAVVSDPAHPGELWVGRGNILRRVTAHNESFRRSTSLVEPEEFRFKTSDGAEIQAWLMKPIGWREDRKYPLILSIHGGPHGMFGYAFNPTFQVYTAQGYAVLYLNPRGSNGYGQKFSDGTLNEWGGGDYRDLMAGVDEALRRYAWIDRDRLGVTGGSYGGFMTNWIITQTPRFKAAVSVASLSNLVSFYSTSLYQDLIHAEFGGFPWDNYELLWQWSPLRYVKQALTPTLFIHGEQDNDVHITQAEEMYMALRRRGVETVLVRYPREGHGLREPKHRVDALERTLAWFDKFLK
jgi:dipeptidyl aminopeptidase/acylaminoacyl peptidase